MPLAEPKPLPVAPESDGVLDAARFQMMRRLMDSLLHDVRNPLNALAIHLDVLVEKLKRENGGVSPGQDKNIRAIREQIFRADGVLKMFNEFLATRPAGEGSVDLSDLTSRAVDVLAYESRRGQVRIRSAIEPGVRVRLHDSGLAPFLVSQVLLRAVARSRSGQEISISVSGGAQATLQVRDPSSESAEPFPEAIPALEAISSRSGGELRIRDGDCVLTLPLAANPNEVKP